MSEKHLSKGSTNPPLAKGKLRLYSMRFCPFAQRALLVLDAKKIPYDVVNINLIQKPEWYLERNPLGKVPALETEAGDCIFESLILADYLDEKYPQTPLYPKDPMQKAKDRILVELFSNVYTSIYKIYTKKKDDEAFKEVLTEFEIFEKELTKRGKTFFGGDKPGMLDYMIWPWCERLKNLKLVFDEKYDFPKDRFPKLVSWGKAMKEDQAVKCSYIDAENHAEFLKSYFAGKPKYDMLVK